MKIVTIMIFAPTVVNHYNITVMCLSGAKSTMNGTVMLKGTLTFNICKEINDDKLNKTHTRG